MAQRLPIPGSDDGTWGGILNGFLEVSLNSDGTLNTSAVTTALPNPIPAANLGAGTPSSSNYLRGDGTWTVPPGAPVTSVFGRTGAVVAGSGDYTAAQVTGALQASNNLSDVASAGSSRANIHIPVLTPAAAVATSNVSSLSGLPTIDGYSLASGDLVLLTAQSTASQNGLWSPASGAWTRPAEFASGATITGRTIEIQNGTSYGGTSWTLATATAGVVIDTGAQSWSITQQTYNDARYGSVITITRQTAAYVFALSDAGTVVESTDASPCTFTIPQSVFPLNTILGARQTTAAGQITLAAAAGVTIDEPGGRYHTNQQWSTIWAHQRNLNEWVLSGDLG